MPPKRRFAIRASEYFQNIRDEMMTMDWVARHDYCRRLCVNNNPMYLVFLAEYFTPDELLNGKMPMKPMPPVIVAPDFHRPVKRQRLITDYFR